METDQILQKVIRTQFSKCTILCIAHRINTIIDSDTVMVLDRGRISEYNHPHKLLSESPHGIFAGLVSELGLSAADSLRALAAEAFNSRAAEADVKIEI